MPLVSSEELQRAKRSEQKDVNENSNSQMGRELNNLRRRVNELESSLKEQVGHTLCA